MTIGQRIKNKREILGLSQDELAHKLGYKSRSSINKIEKDTRNLTQRKIKAIADALETTPAYLMGWEEYTVEELNRMTVTDIRRNDLAKSELMDKILMLDGEDMVKLDGFISGLLMNDKYTKKEITKSVTSKAV